MRQIVNPIIIKIEEYLNSNFQKSLEHSRSFGLKKCKDSDNVISKFDDKEKKKIDEYINGMKQIQTQPDFVCERMSRRGFVYNDGQLNFVNFYTYARINPDVWHTFITQKHKASEDTMFKIIFALQLTEDEANNFLSLGGITFNQSNATHKYILACINTQIFDPDKVYEVLDFYKVHNIYAEKKSHSHSK